MRNTRRRTLTAAAAALASVMAAGCGTTGPSGGAADPDVLQVWALEDAAVNPVVEKGVKRFNEGDGPRGELVTYVNDAYKQKLQVAMGSPQAPDVFFNWGGGNLAQYVEAGQVVDLSSALDDDPEFRDAFLPAVLDVAKVDGKTYGVPMLGVLPVVLFYNKDVFDKAGAEPPETYAELLDLVEVFKDEDVTPITLPGAQAWTELMWLEYLLERVGGADKFQAIVDGEKGAWSDPAVIEALTKCRELVEKGAFGGNYASINYDNGSASALLAQGKSAMFLMGAWEISSLADSHPEFLKDDGLGFTAFPTVAGGKGEDGAVVGNPSNYFSVNADTTDKDAAVDFLTDTLTSDAYVDGLIDAGQVPAIAGIEDRLDETANPEFAAFTYSMVEQAPSFTQSWDQALSPGVSETMLTNLQKVFLGDLSPKEFGAAMEKAE